MRRLIALTGIAVLTALVAPAIAEAASGNPGDPPTVSISKPVAGAASGLVQITAHIETLDPVDSIDKWTVEIVGLGVLCSSHYAQPSTPDQAVTAKDLKLQWDSTKTPAANAGENGCSGTSNPVLPASGALTRNGNVKLKVSVVSYGDQVNGERTAFKEVALAVSNGPAVPTGVALSYDKKNGQIGVSWAANPEPDVSSYRLAECQVPRSSKPCAESDWKVIAESLEGTAAAVPTGAPGIYRYRVAALRPDASGSTMASGWVGPQGDPTEIEVVAPPKPTTSTTAPKASKQESGPQQPIVVTRTVVHPTRRVQRAAPRVLQRVVENQSPTDRGYSETLPYSSADQASGRPLGPGEGGGDQRALLIPLAGGVLLLVFAMQVHYLNRRAHAALEPVEAGEWDEGF